MVARDGIEPSTRGFSDFSVPTPLPISHLRRLPLRIPACPRHIYGTVRMGWAQSAHTRDFGDVPRSLTHFNCASLSVNHDRAEHSGVDKRIPDFLNGLSGLLVHEQRGAAAVRPT
jgi:hypothetical protein